VNADADGIGDPANILMLSASVRVCLRKSTSARPASDRLAAARTAVEMRGTGAIRAAYFNQPRIRVIEDAGRPMGRTQEAHRRIVPFERRLDVITRNSR
jgi:hypothetical protein